MNGKPWILSWCPICQRIHSFDERWTWDGNVTSPTFAPSMLVIYNDARTRVCHSYLRAGWWEYLSDSYHALAGLSAKMVPLPDWLVIL